MAIPVKLLILDPNDNFGNGLKSIRKKESDLIDITNYGEALSDSTSSGNPARVIKDNKVYRIIKTYFDLDNSQRIVLAKLDHDRYDDV